MSKSKFKITIVGGGPVGLFLGICLTKKGIECTILEQRAHPVEDSRSLGIHPVSLELFEKTDLSNDFLYNGVHIKKGLAHDGKKILGSINFDQLEEPFNFILTCPQFKTETILRDKFTGLNPQGFITEAIVTNIHENKEEIICHYQKDGKEHTFSSTYIVGCDGKNSIVRKQSGIFYGGKRYPDTYLMGDFEDNTSFGSNAVVFLPEDGMIESFPLPNKMRRWVVKTDTFVKSPDVQIISEAIHQRVGHDLSNLKSTMLSSFGVQYFEAEYFFKNRMLICGDAAHVVSPIGGQGMNLGWIGAYALAKTLKKVANEKDPEIIEKLFSKFQSRQKKILRKTAKRAEWNMKLGRKQRYPLLRKAFVKFLINTPFNTVAARIFAMKGLD